MTDINFENLLCELRKLFYAEKRVVISEKIILLRVYHDGACTNFRIPGQVMLNITDVPVELQIRGYGLNESEIIGIVKSLGFSGIKQISVFVGNDNNIFTKQYEIKL